MRTDQFAIGADLFAQMVKDMEGVDVPLAQIEAAGKADLARNTAALTDACAEYLPNGTLAACVAKMSANKPKRQRHRRGPCAIGRPESVHPKARHRDDPQQRRSAGRSGAALQRGQFRVHQHPRSLRPRSRLDLQHRAARSKVDQGRAG